MIDQSTAIVLAKEAVKRGGPFAVKKGLDMFDRFTAKRRETKALKAVFAEAARWSPDKAVQIVPVVEPQEHRLSRREQTVFFGLRILCWAPFPVCVDSIKAGWQLWDGSATLRGQLLNHPTFGTEILPFGYTDHECSITDVTSEDFPPVLRLVIKGEAILSGPWLETPKQKLEIYGVCWLPVKRD